MPEITIRTASRDDVDFLVRGNASMAQETEHIALDPVRLRQGVEAIFEASQRGVYYIAEIGGERAGQMLITYEWSDWRNGDFWWIQSVWVEPACRAQGVFRTLYSNVESLARSRSDVCGLRLYVERENARAQSTYERCGMKHTVYEMFEVDFVLGESARFTRGSQE